MQSPRFQSLTARFTSSGLRTSFSSSSRRSQRSTSSSSTRSSIVSSASHLSPVETINSVIIRQPSIVNLEEERKSCGPEQMGILEPRPIVYWGSVEERMAIF